EVAQRELRDLDKASLSYSSLYLGILDLSIFKDLQFPQMSPANTR
ncbi:MAG: hypothetical protein RL095_4180, partial [Verrucomicrobiota bacterium]